MTFHIVKGDLFDPDFEFDALAQGVNTYGKMGSGIAVDFSEKWPEMYESYQFLCGTHGDRLGGLVHIWNPEPTVTELKHDDGESISFTFEVDQGTTIYNMFSQLAPGSNGDYELLYKAAILVRQDAESQGFERVGLPWIGCGIAGLEKHNVQHIFETVWGDSDVDFILVEQPAPVAKPLSNVQLDVIGRDFD